MRVRSGSSGPVGLWLAVLVFLLPACEADRSPLGDSPRSQEQGSDAAVAVPVAASDPIDDDAPPAVREVRGAAVPASARVLVEGERDAMVRVELSPVEMEAFLRERYPDHEIASVANGFVARPRGAEGPLVMASYRSRGVYMLQIHDAATSARPVEPMPVEAQRSGVSLRPNQVERPEQDGTSP